MNPSRWLPSLVLAALTCLPTLAAHAAPPGKTQQLTSPDQVPDGLAKSDWQGIRAAYEAGRHTFQPTASGWEARNPGQQWLTTFDRRGFIARPMDGGWQWGLELQSYGFGENQRPISGTPVVKADGRRLTYQWDSHVLEWFINDQRGLEHGFTIGRRPDGGSDQDPRSRTPALSFTLAVRGGLHPQVTGDALGVDFRDAAGATVLTYAGLKVWDVDGRVLPSRFEPPDPRHPSRVVLSVDERGARYPLTIDPVAQQAYLKASNTAESAQFGISVAVSGDTVVVGAYLENSRAAGVNGNQEDNSAGLSGAAYVFTRSGTTWTQQAYLKASNTGRSDRFGNSVAVSGDTVVVGAYLEDSNATGVNGNQADNSSGNSGAAYVFTRSGTAWTQQAYLKASNTGSGDQFGGSVAVSGDTVVVGAYLESSNATGVDGNQADDSAVVSGAAYVFTRSGTTWTQQAYLKASNTGAGDQFGGSVAVSGDTAVIGAFGEDSNATGVDGNQADNSSADSGAAYVFTRSGTMWTQQAYLKASNSGADDRFGYSAAVSGDTVVAGAHREASNATGVDGTATGLAGDSGAAYIFSGAGPVQPPMVNPQSLTVLGTGAFQFTFTNVANTTFRVLATTNVSLPSTDWTVLGNATNAGGGVYQFTDPGAAGLPQRFYRLRGQ